MTSGFGEVFTATNKKDHTTVAVKRVSVALNPAEINNEVKMLQECVSPFIVRYYDVYYSNRELWVG